MKTCENVKLENKTTVFDFLMKQTPVHSKWIINDGGWRIGIVWIDHEDLWISWFPNQHKNTYVKLYSYNEIDKRGYIEIEYGSISDEDVDIANISTNVKTIIYDQLTRFWPTRVEDFKQGKIEVTIKVVISSSDDEYFNNLKLKTGKTDPECVLIVGFNQAILFLQQYIVDMKKEGD